MSSIYFLGRIHGFEMSSNRQFPDFDEYDPGESVLLTSASGIDFENSWNNPLLGVMGQDTHPNHKLDQGPRRHPTRK
jgi:hypothetical protein